MRKKTSIRAPALPQTPRPRRERARAASIANTVALLPPFPTRKPQQRGHAHASQTIPSMETTKSPHRQRGAIGTRYRYRESASVKRYRARK